MAATAISTSLFILLASFSVIHARSMLAHSKIQLEQSTSKLNQVKNQLEASFVSQFSETGETAVLADGAMSNENVFNAISLFLAKLGPTYAGYDNSLDGYTDGMTSGGSWNNVYTVSNSGLTGVSPPQASGTVHEALSATSISIVVHAERTSQQQGETKVSFSVTQEYADCQSFFVPCDGFITK